MCGILLRVSKEPIKKPLCIPQPIQTLQGSSDLSSEIWDTTDPDVIKTFLQQGEKLRPLSPQQVRKLNSLDELRDLTKQLAKVKNNVKLPQEVKEDQVRNIQDQIDDISREDEDNYDDKNHHHTDVNKHGSKKKEEKEDREDKEMESLIYKTSNRGPNYLNYTQFKIDDNYYFQSFSAILSLRQPFTKQPIFKDEFVLQFNGELYNSECLETNDTQYIIDLLHSKIKSNKDRKSAILNTLKELSGEWAIILVDLRECRVYFGRDPIGKRSLCYKVSYGSNRMKEGQQQQQQQEEENEKEGIEIIISSNSGIGFLECKNEIYEYSLAHNSKGLISHKLKEITRPTFDLPDEQVVLAELKKQLKAATKIRQDSIHPLTHLPNESVLAVLFSGGLDCTIVARLICELISNSNGHTSLDLLTVGFENPRTLQAADSGPDRKLAIKSWFHLCHMFPKLKINLVEINVDYQSWLSHKSRVKELMYPCNTEMDLSIAIAFYFASSILPDLTSAKCLTNDNVSWEEFVNNQEKYTIKQEKYLSSAKVMFSGLGADELFAGYSRHEGIFNNINVDNISGDESNYIGLAESLNYDIEIIHQRNLGRDDRVMSCWGKELRYPYLDEDFISWVISTIPPNMKFKYSFAKDKKGKNRLVPIRKYILRKLAEELGMSWVSQELKRAIQFGAKSAKLEIGQSKSKGTDSL